MRSADMNYTDLKKLSSKIYKSFEEDFEGTVKKLKDTFYFFESRKDNTLLNFYAYKIIELAIEKEVDFSSLPLEFFSFIKGTFYKYQDNQKEMWDNAYKLGHPLVFLPRDYLMLKLEEEHEKIDYSNVNIEDELRRIAKLNLKEINIKQLDLLKVYAEQKIKKDGLDTRIYFFHQDRNSSSLGDFLYDHDKIYISGIYNHFRKVEDLIYIINHETNHAKQEINMRNERYDLDNNLDLMIKDTFLRDVIGYSYYEKNYNATTFEFDADLKAYIQLQELFGNIDEEFREKLESLYKNSQLNRVKNYHDKNFYKFNLDRKKSLFVREHIDDYLIHVLNKEKKLLKEPYRSKHYGKIMRFLKYNDKKFVYELKDIKDLFDDYCKGEDSKIYFNIMKQKLNPNKYPHTYKEDVEKLNELMINIEEYPIKIKQALLELSVYANKTKYDIYKDYFDSYAREKNQQIKQKR